MIISKIDFGPIDARNDFASDLTRSAPLSSVFVNPFGIDIDDYKRGRKCFIFGIKGSGKSTLLRIVKQRVEQVSEVEFLYFSEALQDRANGDAGDEPIPPAEFAGRILDQSFWRSFFMLVIAKHIKKHSSTAASKKFLKFVHTQATGEQGTFSSIVSVIPRLKNWATTLDYGLGNTTIEGDFLRLGDINLFYDSALSLLRDVKIARPFYLFLDEMEISFTSSEQFAKDVTSAAALVKEVRDLNEFFRSRSVPIFIVCAIRKEVSQKILGQDAAKIVRDLGYELTWQRPAWSTVNANYYHPLFEIVLRRIYASIYPQKVGPGWKDLDSVERQYFDFRNSGWTQSYILDLTTYRPRDIPILFSRAKQFDGGKSRFSKETFSRLVRKAYKDDLWVDFQEALRTEYSEKEVTLFGRIFFALPSYFRMEDFARKADDFSADPDLAKILESFTAHKWSSFLKDLYELGAVGWSEIKSDEERVHFHFRGDTSGLQISKTNYIVKPIGLRD